MISIKKIRVSLNKRKNCLPKCPYHSLTLAGSYSNPKSFVNFLLPPRTRGEGWGGVKNLRLLQGLRYLTQLCPKNSELKFEGNTKEVLIIRFPVVGDSVNPETDLISGLGWWNRQTRLASSFSA